MRARPVVALCLVLLASPTVRGQEDDPVLALVEQERIRAIVEQGFADVGLARRQFKDDTAFVEAYTDIAYRLGTAEAGVIPLLANEALQADRSTFFLSAYALAFQATPEAIEALYEAVARADAEQTGYAEARKAHLIWALASAGEAEAVRLADAGRHLAGDDGVHRQMSVLEAATIMTAPASLEILHEELSQDSLLPPEEWVRTLYAIRAVGRVGHPSSLPVLLALVKHENVLIRIEVAKALAQYPDKESIDTLFAALFDDHRSVSSYAALSLLVLSPPDRFSQVAEQFEKLENPTARKALYRLLVQLDPEASIPILTRRVNGAATEERLHIFEAAAKISSPEVIDLLVHAIGDPEIKAGITAARALARMDEPRAHRVLVRAIESHRWPLAQTAAKLAAERRLPGADEAIRNRLLDIELPRLVRRSTDKPQAEWLLDRTIELEDVKALRGLEKAREVQKDGLLVKRIETAIRQLRAVRDAGEDLEKWEAFAFDEDPAVRSTAYRHLGRFHDAEPAAAILSAAFGRVDPVESLIVLEHAGEADSDNARELVERVLTRPEYQLPELYAVRKAAAWAARRLGGERMSEALRRSIELRHGRDIHPIIYYTLLEGRDSLPLLEKFIASRMRFAAVTRGNEYKFLRELLTALRLDRPIVDDGDRPPGERDFM